MIRRATFAVIALFWVVMNAWLWRSEFGGANLSSSVPPGAVWEKILTAPDDSSLSFYAQNQRIGFLRVRPRVNEGSGTVQIASEDEPEGIVRKVTEYILELEGSLVMQDLARSIRFNGDLVFGTDLRWKRFRTQTHVRPFVWEVKGDFDAKELWFRSAEGDSEWIQRFTPEDLREPGKLATVLESPALAAMLPQVIAAASQTNAPLSFSLPWEARFEWLQIGRNRVRIYRLEAKLLDRHRIVVLVSRVGEILRIELPGEYKLVNDVLYAT